MQTPSTVIVRMELPGKLYYLLEWEAKTNYEGDLGSVLSEMLKLHVEMFFEALPYPEIKEMLAGLRARSRNVVVVAE